MSLLPGTRLGSIEILGLIGAGGMGEVYHGHDTRLGREVAVKSLPESFAGDAERRARFEREAQVLASLNHPNIAALHDLRDHDGSTYLLLELVDGETLAERIAVAARAGGGLPIVDALDIARQIAEALDAAHARGIVHRDLKPANIKLTGDGVVKVLDFGLAKVAEPSLASDTSHSPTLSIMLSAAGVILGTAPYMSPEQARGSPVDKRADIWSFGCILFELLSGRQAFPGGETTSDTLAAVLTRDPDWSVLAPGTPGSVRRLIERCLRKDPRTRLRDIGDAHSDIVDALREPDAASRAAPVPTRRREFVLAAMMVLFGALTAGLWWTRSSTPPIVGEQLRFDVAPEGVLGNPGDQGLAAMIPFPTLSPDGRSLAYVASFGGRNELWLHRFSTGTPQPIRGSDGAVSPFWSPRSDAIAFFTGDQLKRVNVVDESVQVIATGMIASTASGSQIIGGTWGRDDVILLGQTAGPLLRVSARGGDPEALTTLDSSLGETSHRFPEFLPDNRHYTYAVMNSNPAQSSAFVGAIDSSERRPLPGVSGRSRYSVTGHLIFVRQRNVWAQPFDLGQLELTGEPVQIAASVGVNPTIGPFSVSETGAVAFRAAGEATRSRLVWFDRDGRELGSPGRDAEYRNIDLSPDGRFVAFQAGAPDVWMLDLQRGVVSRVTTDGGSFPVWSHDGKDVFFRAIRAGVEGVFRRTVGGAAAEQLVVKGDVYVNGLWDEGRFTYTTRGIGGFDVWLAGSSADAQPTRLTETRFGETYTTPSPNGKAIAFAIDETGRWEVMIQTIASGQRTQVSNLGGILPKWSADGRELFYIAPDDRLMAVPVKWAGDIPEVGVPVPLFQTRIVGGGTYVAGLARQYGVASDGRFLMQVPAGDERPSPITVILNWNAR